MEFFLKKVFNAITGSFPSRLRHIRFGMRNEAPGFARTPAFTKMKELGARGQVVQAWSEHVSGRTGERDAFSSPLQCPAPEGCS